MCTQTSKILPQLLMLHCHKSVQCQAQVRRLSSSDVTITGRRTYNLDGQLVHQQPSVRLPPSSKKTTACGTIRSNRVPSEVKNAKLDSDQVSAFRSALLCLKFCDKKDVHMLMNQHYETVVPAPKGRGRPSVTRAATKPSCVVEEYNSNMGSVDKQNQMLQPYSIARKKIMKWYKKK